MKTALKTVLAIMGGAASAFASGEASPEGGGLLMPLFFGFGACVLMFQAVPAVVLFVSMLKGLFAADRQKAAPAAEKELC